MHEIWTTVVGNVVTDPEYSMTRDGVPMLRFRIANTPGNYENGQWVDRPTSYLTVKSFRALAGNGVSSISKGEPIVAYGKLSVREYTSAEGRRVETQLEAQVMGHNLARGTAMFRRTAKALLARAEPAPAVEAPADPWATAGPDAPPYEREEDDDVMLEEAEELISSGLGGVPAEGSGKADAA